MKQALSKACFFCAFPFIQSTSPHAIMNFNDSTPYETDADPATTATVDPPKSATVLGVINVIFGLLGILSGVIGLVFLMLMVTGAMELPDEAMSQQISSPMAIGSAIVGMLLSIVLVIAGWGLIQFKPFGRTLSIWYALLSIVFALIGIVVGSMEIPGAIASFDTLDSEDPQQINAAMTPIIGVVSNCVSMIYPIILLIFMNRRSFVEALRARQGA